MSEIEGAPDGGPYPDPRRAILLTIGALFASGLVGVFFIGLGPVAAAGIGQALAVGAIATISAKRVAEPQAERIGLRKFDLGSLPTILCLVPVVLLISELDNYAADWFPESVESAESTEVGEAGETYEELDASIAIETADPLANAEQANATAPSEVESEEGESAELSEEDRVLEQFRVDLDDPWTIAQAFVISVGITPVVEEFFFRGVVQQSLVSRLGMMRGIAFVAVLYTLPHLPLVAGLPRFLLGVCSALGMGCLLGLVRMATGSILASIVLASSTAAIGVFSFAMKDRLPLPGMNVEGTHLPVMVTLPCIVIVGWATSVVYTEARRRYEAERAGGPGKSVGPGD